MRVGRFLEDDCVVAGHQMLCRRNGFRAVVGEHEGGSG